jgi:hypothetical protein
VLKKGSSPLTPIKLDLPDAVSQPLMEQKTLKMMMMNMRLKMMKKPKMKLLIFNFDPLATKEPKSFLMMKLTMPRMTTTAIQEFQKVLHPKKLMKRLFWMNRKPPYRPSRSIRTSSTSGHLVALRKLTDLRRRKEPLFLHIS